MSTNAHHGPRHHPNPCPHRPSSRPHRLLTDSSIPPRSPARGTRASPSALPSYNSSPLPTHTFVIQKHIPQIQRLLLTHIAPVWAPELAKEDEGQESLLTAYFVPDVFYNSRQAAGDIARLAYGTLVSAPMTEFGLKCLERLVVEYPIDRIYFAVFGDGKSNTDKRIREVEWEDCVRDVCMVPGKVANSLAERARTDTPETLENGIYFGRLSVRLEVLIWELSIKDERHLDALAYLFTKLVNVGLFPARPPVARSQPSFFSSALPAIRARLDMNSPTPSAYNVFWHSIFLVLPSSLTLQSILASLFGTLAPTVESINPSTDASAPARSRMRGEAALLQSVVGSINPGGDKQALWEVATSVVLDREWPEAFARVFVAWISGGARGAKINLKGNKVLEAFLDVVLDLWASPEHIKHSLISRHRYTTALFLLTASYLPASSTSTLVSNPTFIKGISTYISHLDPAVRRCGMLAAEVIAQRAEKKLAFGDWEGDDQGRPWCQVASPANDIPRATFVPTLSGYDSDDSMTGYASPPSSSRSSSPTPAELAEIEAEPTLNVGRQKVARPVYLAQLGDLLRGSTAVGAAKGGGPDDPHEADRIEMGLTVAEELIRRKMGYGTELEENAVNLVCILLGMNNNYELDGFDEKRQGALRALVVGAPTKAAPTLIQEFFKNQYSVEQRFVALNALALGARELAGLPVPPTRVPEQRTAFPSKTLPAPLHRNRLTLEKERAASETAPEIVRERRLRLQKPRPGVTELPAPSDLNPYSAQQAPLARPPTRFIDVAAAHFIMPLIHAFWAFLRDEQAREARTAHQPGRGRPLVLAQLLRTLAILVHAAQHAPEWIGIVAPGALELAVTAELEADGAAAAEEDRQAKEAAVLTAALELALVVLNGALELDGGRILGLEHTTLVLGLREWAEKVFTSLERGLRVQGGGGLHEVKLSRAAAGVLLKIDELMGKWSRSMLDTR
ncbi:telomere length regulation protein-domain-containing protein [Pholiota molesta]|nr:telomere length regulation protein-domain-containing protein [Pholiota molesta]